MNATQRLTAKLITMSNMYRAFQVTSSTKASSITTVSAVSTYILSNSS